MAEREKPSLAGIGLLAGLSEEARGALEKRCRWRRYGDGELIIDRESETRDVFFVIEGRVRVVNHSASGREIAFAEVEPGGHFGDMAAIDGQPRSASIVSLTDTLVASLSPDAFIALLKDNPDSAFIVMRDLAGIVRAAVDRIMDLSTLGANNRVYAEILRLARPTVGDKNEAVIKPIPVHGDIASRVSTTRETVARVFGDLTRQGVLKRERDAIIVFDIAQLEHMVEEFRGA